MKERISELEDRNLEMLWVNKETELIFFYIKKLYEGYQTSLEKPT